MRKTRSKKGAADHTCRPQFGQSVDELDLRRRAPEKFGATAACRLSCRPLDADEKWLWIGRQGGQPLCPTSVSSIISNSTKRQLGRAVSPHLFRDCAATDIALLDPEHVGITPDVLGHKTLASSQKFYNQAGSFKALASWERVLTELVDG